MIQTLSNTELENKLIDILKTNRGVTPKKFLDVFLGTLSMSDQKIITKFLDQLIFDEDVGIEHKIEHGKTELIFHWIRKSA